jgi:hypothetical protein
VVRACAAAVLLAHAARRRARARLGRARSRRRRVGPPQARRPLPLRALLLRVAPRDRLPRRPPFPPAPGPPRDPPAASPRSSRTPPQRRQPPDPLRRAGAARTRRRAAAARCRRAAAHCAAGAMRGSSPPAFPSRAAGPRRPGSVRVGLHPALRPAVHLASCISHLASRLLHLASCILHLAFCILHLASGILPRSASCPAPWNALRQELSTTLSARGKSATGGQVTDLALPAHALHAQFKADFELRACHPAVHCRCARPPALPPPLLRAPEMLVLVRWPGDACPFACGPRRAPPG